MREQLTAILKLNGIDPDVEIETDVGTRTAVEILESAVEGALDEIEEKLA
jgi:hypothetical protein